MNRILVAYASKHGATAEIAEKISQVIRRPELKTDVLSVENVPTLAVYQAVIVGSAVYAGQWRKEAVDFLTKNEAMLTGMPTWFFSSGPTGEGDPDQLVKGWRIPEALQETVERIHPHDIAVFHGDIDTSELSFGEKLIVKGVRAPVGDFRDWKAITNWATGIAETLMKEEMRPQPTA
jgi:menaquinone-dependent protoporphyrinogen oxidase